MKLGSVPEKNTPLSWCLTVGWLAHSSPPEPR